MDLSYFSDDAILDAANMYAQSDESSIEINDCLLDPSLDMDLSLDDLPVGNLLDNFWKDLNAQNSSSLNQDVSSDISLCTDLPVFPPLPEQNYQLEEDCNLFTTKSGGNIGDVIPNINQENIYDNVYVEVDSSNMEEDISILLGIEKKKESPKTGKQQSNRKLSRSAPNSQMSQKGRKRKRTCNDDDQVGCPVNVTEEERRLLAKSGVILPDCYPLSRNEETELKRLRRKLRNKEAARESRRKKKKETDGLRERLAQTEKALKMQMERTLKISQSGTMSENGEFIKENSPTETLLSFGESILGKITISRPASVVEVAKSLNGDAEEPERQIRKIKKGAKMFQAAVNKENGENVGKCKDQQQQFGCVLALVLLTVMVVSSSVKKACPDDVNFRGLQELQTKLQCLNASFSHHPCNTADEIQAILFEVRRAVIFDQLLVSSIASMVGVPVSDVAMPSAMHDHDYFGSKASYKMRPMLGVEDVERKNEREEIVVDESQSSTSDESAYNSDMEWSEVGENGNEMFFNIRSE